MPQVSLTAMASLTFKAPLNLQAYGLKHLSLQLYSGCNQLKI